MQHATAAPTAIADAAVAATASKRYETKRIESNRNELKAVFPVSQVSQR